MSEGHPARRQGELAQIVTFDKYAVDLDRLRKALTTAT
jgi:hypothetical protein